MKIQQMAGSLFVALMVLAGCTSGSDSAESGLDASYDSAAGEIAPMDPTDGGAEEGEEREVVTTGSLTLVARDASAAAEEIVALVEGAGGRVDARSKSVATEYQEASTWLTLRVPAADLNDTISEVEQLGEVTEMSIASDDVTRWGRDLDARINALEASTERLLELMEKADSSEALIAAEGALSERQGDLEALWSERNHLSDQVAMSTLEVSIISEPTAQFEAGGFLAGLASGWNALVGFASGALVALGVALPWLVVLGVPIAAVVFLLHRRRPRRDKDEPQPDFMEGQ